VQPKSVRVKAKRPIALGSRDARDSVRAGGVASGKRDSLRRAPLRESYGALSGTAPEHAGTPETVTGSTSGRKLRRRARSTG
jgi:hypothetical protein